MKYLLLLIGVIGCSGLKKDNEPQSVVQFSDEIATQLSTYRPLLAEQLDRHGLVVLGSSIGDSALMSCMARFGGVTKFDVSLLFTAEGKPLRHPDISPGYADAPISKDMVNGILWCLYDIGREDKAKALELVERMISYGKDHRAKLGGDIEFFGWMFCDDQDRHDYAISDRDWYGLCYMTPSVIKDIYRVARWVGYECDWDCKLYSFIGVNIPEASEGFPRHLAVLTTLRNGCVEDGLNDKSVDYLRKAAEDQQQNAVFQAAYHLFTDGQQEPAYAALNSPRFPKDRLPTRAEYCTHYLWERDFDAGEPNSDWDGCPNETSPDRGRGNDFAFAAELTLRGCGK